MPPSKARRKLRDGFEGPWKGPGGVPDSPARRSGIQQAAPSGERATNRTVRWTEHAKSKLRFRPTHLNNPTRTPLWALETRHGFGGRRVRTRRSRARGPGRSSGEVPSGSTLCIDPIVVQFPVLRAWELEKPLPYHPNPLHGKGLCQVSECAAVRSKGLWRTFRGPPEAPQHPSREQFPKDPGAGYRTGWSG